MKNSGEFSNVAQRFLLIFLPFFVFATVITAGFLFQELKSQKKSLKADEMRAVEVLQRVATNDVKSVVSDLVFLSSHHVLRQMLEDDQPAIRRKIAKIFLDFCKTAALYDQVRFMDETGMERIRINFGDGRPYIVPDKNLQSKAKRYYFVDTFKLEPGRIFVSPLDLNIERGRIEQPLKPMIRLGTPVVDLNGRKRGIVLLNYFGEKLIQYIDQASTGVPSTCMLLNSEGYWLKGLQPEDEWSFMYKDRTDRTMAQRDPQTWQKIIAQDSGQFRNNHGIYSFATIWPLGKGMLSSTGSGDIFKPSNSEVTYKEYYWKVVSFIPAELLGQRTAATLLSWLPLYGVVIIFLAFVSWRLALAAFRRKQAEEALRHAAAFKTLTTVLENFIGDALGNLLTPIYGRIELCEKRYSSIDQIKSELGNIKQGIKEFLTCINTYREFAEALEGSLGRKSSVDIRSILGPLLSGQPLKTYGEEEFPIDSNMHLQFVYDPKKEGALSWEDLPSVSGSENAIATALQEILINAVESYDPKKGGDVVVSAKKEDHRLILEIADKGRGMSNDDRDKSQLPFYKIGGVKDSGRFGLGAYVARESTKYCGGDMQIVSTEGVGTTVSILLKVSD